MALDNAIRNVGEYYAAHYLADNKGFVQDIQTHSKRWKQQGSQSVVRRLQGLSEAYYKAKTRALDYAEAALRARSEAGELRSWHSQLIDALGYQAEPVALELVAEQKQLPVLLRLNRHNQPWLVVCETAFCLSDGENDEEPLETNVIAAPIAVQQSENASDSADGLPTLIASWEKAVALLFKQEDRPRWVLLLSGSRIYLFDAHTYAQGRYLYIDLDDAFGRKQSTTFEAICALLACEALAPEAETDEVLHERLREGSLKSTHGVSEKLQAVVRDAIQVLANGWVAVRKKQQAGYKRFNEREKPLPDGSREITAEKLRHDALVFVYRLLFCLYAEARGGEMGVLPISDEVYRLGYSLEALRDLVEAAEPSTTTEDGTYIAEHLDQLFRLIHQGFDPEKTSQALSTEPGWQDFGRLPEQSDLFGGSPAQQQLSLNDPASADTSTSGAADHLERVFRIEPLTATLFAPDAMPILSRVKLPNRVLYQVLRYLSLGTGDKGKQVGRINYAELGIVQLGSVYEGLLSYQGFFAREDLLQVLQKPKGGKPVLDDALDPHIPTWFVPVARLSEFKAGEVVLEHRTKKPRIYNEGEFILHLNGVDRENSASYYTPEVLTRCLVREALKERLRGFTPEQADAVLTLKICEPAMGSAAFLVETIDQLGHAYLRLKQRQTGRTIDPSEYEEELRRVRHYIAVHNVYGVDLNPTAVELGALSLWLASIHRLRIKRGDHGAADQYRPCATPWFGLRLRAGNSLIGARRAVWTEQQLVNGQFYGKSAQSPRQLKPGEARQPGEIYHFLVWDEDMAAAANDKLMKQHWPEECAAVREWRNKQVKQKWTPEDIAKARAICERVDVLWEEYAQARVVGLEKTACTATVWPTASGDVAALLPSAGLGYQESIKNNLEAQSGAFQRLKLLMDSWCSFYFWPLPQSEALPSRAAWLAAAEMVLGGKAVQGAEAIAMLDLALSPFMDVRGLAAASGESLPDVGKLAAFVPWFGVAQAVDAEQHFHHWELIFTEILGPEVAAVVPHGFDLMFGNPPWMKVTWNDAPLLSEFEPMLGVRVAKSALFNRERPHLLAAGVERLAQYRDGFTAAEGSSAFLNDKTLYPALVGVQTNLYKNFIERSWGLLSEEGHAGLLHPPNCFDDPNGGFFRENYYSRLKAHYQFSNQLMWFQDIGHRNPFSVNIYSGQSDEVDFYAVFNLFHPTTLMQIEKHNRPDDPVPGIKTSQGTWDFTGHQYRKLHIRENELSMFATLFEDEGTAANHARLPQVHSQPLMEVLKKFSQVPQRLGDLKGQYLATEMFHESNAQRDGIITRVENPSYQPASAEDWVISGPHFFVGTPFYKTPRTTCTEKGHYDTIDLETVPDDYLPRAVYRPGDKDGNLDAFYAAIPEWPKPTKPYQDDQQQWHNGFWPVADADVPAWEALLGEPLRRYGMDTSLPGAKTARQFGYFARWEGDMLEAVAWLSAKGNQRHSEAFNARFMGVRVVQVEPDEGQMLWLPKPLTAYVRLFYRRRGQPANERALIPTISPRGVSHIHPVISFAFIDERFSIVFAGHSISLLHDFLIRVAGRSDIYESTLRAFPIVDQSFWLLIISRTLRLCCITQDYSALWNSHYADVYSTDSFACPYAEPWNHLTPTWNHNTAFRTDKERYQAALELDVILALGFGLKLEELIQVYFVQFSALVGYERVDQYDAKGRRLPNTTRKDAGAKELREALKNHDGTSPITVSWAIDNGKQTRTQTYYPPFQHVDRIEDYRTAYRVFSERLGLT